MTASPIPFSLLRIEPLPGYTPAVGRLVGMLEYARATTFTALDGLKIEELDYLHDDRSNSIGALLALARSREGWRELCAGHRDRVEWLRNKFGENTPDEVWLQELGGEGDWKVICTDLRILTRNSPERAAWKGSGLTGFFSPQLSAGALLESSPERRQDLPDLQTQADRTPVGKGFLLPKAGQVFTELEP